MAKSETEKQAWGKENAAKQLRAAHAKAEQLCQQPCNKISEACKCHLTVKRYQALNRCCCSCKKLQDTGRQHDSAKLAAAINSKAMLNHHKAKAAKVEEQYEIIAQHEASKASMKPSQLKHLRAPKASRISADMPTRSGPRPTRFTTTRCARSGPTVQMASSCDTCSRVCNSQM